MISKHKTEVLGFKYSNIYQIVYKCVSIFIFEFFNIW